MEKQRTIKDRVTYSGKGLHTGNETSISFCPAPENYGYRFIRTDLPEQIEIEALVDNVVDLSRGTTLGVGDVKVHTVEHVLAALVGLQIDNCRIELSGNEPPVGDGSSMPYVETLLKAGIQEQEAERVYFNIDETVRYTNEAKGVDIVALPTDDFRITVMVDYYNPALGSQHTGLFNLDKEFITEFAPARTFCFLNEVEMLREAGLIKGGDINTAVVIVDKELTEDESLKLKDIFNLDEPPFLGENGILNNIPLRYKNEPARHKLLDMLGDLSLAGVRIKAQVLAARPGHASNIEFAKKIRALWKKKSPIISKLKTESKKAILDIYDLMKIMPHRYPFLLIDKIVDMDLEEMRITGIKNVTVNEPFFIGHFPNKPIMPGVLICEALAQTGCMLIMNTVKDFHKLLILYLGIKNAKFRKPVIPGDVLVMDVVMTGKKFNTYSFKGTASVNGVVATEIEFQAAAVEKDYE